MAGPFRATHTQIKTLSALILLLTVLIFWPGRRQLLSFVARNSVVATQYLEVAIPRGWQVRTGETSIDAWRTPVSVFSDWQVTSMTVSSVKDRLDGEILTEDEWRESIRATFGKQGHREYVERSFVGRSGQVLCLEASSQRPSRTTVSSCFIADDSLLGVFDGNVEHLSTFYDVMKTCIRRSRDLGQPESLSE